MTEAQLQTKVMKYLKSNGIYARKLHDTYTSGLPDIICCIKGHFVAIELKSTKGKLSKIQMVEAAKIIKAGGKYFVVRSMDELYSLEIEKNNKTHEEV